MTNIDHRRDVRTEAELQDDLIRGIELQVRLARVVQAHLKLLSLRIGTLSVRVNKDSTLNRGEYRDTGDGEIRFRPSADYVAVKQIEFKTKALNDDAFTLKKEDLVRCVKLSKPVIMANRMVTQWPQKYGVGRSFKLPKKGKGLETYWQCRRMMIRCMTLQEMAAILQHPAGYPVRIGGAKQGWTLNEDAWDDWIPWDEVRPARIKACYRKCLPELFDQSGVTMSFPWTKNWSRYVMP